MSTTATVFILMFVGTGLAQEPAGRKLYAVDESHLDPSFAEFKARLLEAVERQDLDFLVSIAHPRIYLGNEVSSPESLKRGWGGQMNWQELRDMLSLGAVRSQKYNLETGTFYVGSGFCAPYVSSKFPDDLDALGYVVITGSDVPVRAEPKSTASIIDRLSYNIVKRMTLGQRTVWETIEGEEYHWWRIETPAGEIGYVWAKYARSPMGFEVCFGKTDGQWMMTAWTAGD